MRKAYQSDLSDAEWSCLKPHLPVPEAHGRPRLHTLREVLDAIFYIVRGGCAWRLLPHDFPPWKTAYHYFRSWRLDGTCTCPVKCVKVPCSYPPKCSLARH
jgi:putative transposase